MMLKIDAFFIGFLIFLFILVLSISFTTLPSFSDNSKDIPNVCEEYTNTEDLTFIPAQIGEEQQCLIQVRGYLMSLQTYYYIGTLESMVQSLQLQLKIDEAIKGIEEKKKDEDELKV